MKLDKNCPKTFNILPKFRKFGHTNQKLCFAYLPPWLHHILQSFCMSVHFTIVLLLSLMFSFYVLPNTIFYRPYLISTSCCRNFFLLFSMSHFFLSISSSFDGPSSSLSPVMRNFRMLSVTLIAQLEQRTLIVGKDHCTDGLLFDWFGYSTYK